MRQIDTAKGCRVICEASRGLHRTPDCVLAIALGTLAQVAQVLSSFLAVTPAEVTNGRMDSYLSEVQGSLPAFSNQRRRNGQFVRPPETACPADRSRMRLPKLWAQRSLPANRPVVPRLRARIASLSQWNESLKTARVRPLDHASCVQRYANIPNTSSY